MEGSKSEKVRVITQKYVNQVAYESVGCAIEVHRILGPGLLESVYHECMCEELRRRGISFLSQVRIPIIYKGINLNKFFKADLLMEDVVMAELKAVETMVPLYKSQMLTYLNLTDKPKGLLINFNCENIVEQLVPLVTMKFAKLPKE